MSIDFYVKVRDVVKMIADAANEQLEKMALPEVNHKGFWQSSNYKYWFHSQNTDIIDRRKK